MLFVLLRFSYNFQVESIADYRILLSIQYRLTLYIYSHVKFISFAGSHQRYSDYCWQPRCSFWYCKLSLDITTRDFRFTTATFLSQTLCYDLTANYLDMIVKYVSLFILMSRIDDRKAIIGLYNHAHDMLQGKTLVSQTLFSYVVWNREIHYVLWGRGVQLFW